MTDHIEESPPNSPQDDPSSTAYAQTTKAPKDKACPFCKTPYTASSLGRHLDSYIREKNPKPSDGIHDLVEIKKIRDGITRRNVLSKTGSSKRRSKARSKSAAASRRSSRNDDDEEMDEHDDESPQSPAQSAPRRSLNKTETGDAIRYKSNYLGWQATGVINDLPPSSARAASGAGGAASRDVSRRRALKADNEARQRNTEEVDTAKAAECALKEVLEKIKEAGARAAQIGLFDFNPYELSFPALCLKVLPAPTTLKSQLPFPTNDSWTIAPPGARQSDALHRIVQEKVASYQRILGAAQTSGLSPPLTPVDVDAPRLRNHLNDAWSYWQTLSAQHKMEMWQLETLRMFSDAEESRKRIETKLDTTKRENEELRKELVRLRCEAELGPEDGCAPRPASGASLPSKIMQQMLNEGFDPRQWDYDLLMQKWRSTMREQRESTRGLSAQRRLSAPKESVSQVRSEPRGRPAPKFKVSSARTEAPNSSRNMASNNSATSQSNQDQDADAEIDDVDEPRPQPRPTVPQTSQSSLPISPQSADTSHLGAQAMQSDQRRTSIQMSPHSISQQQEQRRHSLKYPQQISPQPQQQHGQQQPPPQMIPYSQGPLLQIPVAENHPASHAVPMQPPYPAQTNQMPNWMHPQQQHQHQQHQQHHQQQLQQQRQRQQQPHGPQPHRPLPTVPVPRGPSETPGDFMQYANMGLQLPQSADGRRHSHPMIAPSAQHVEMQGIEPVPPAPASTGGYIDARMHHQVGMDGMGMQVGFVGPGMDMPVVDAGGGRVG